MKSRPIPFSGAMVRAILDGTKTQTRRVCLSMLWDTKTHGPNPAAPHWYVNWSTPKPCPYGQPGDTLYVRESYYQFGHWEPVEGKKTKGGRQKWAFVPDSGEILFNSSDVPGGSWRLGRHNEGYEKPAWHKRLARFMPKAASRITLEIVSVRVERLQEISEEDAIAEGIGRPIGGCFFNYAGIPPMPTGRESYRTLWESINGPGSWEANPFVWVVEFRRVQL